MRKIIIEKELIEGMYLGKELSTIKIAKKLNVDQKTVWNKINELIGLIPAEEIVHTNRLKYDKKSEEYLTQEIKDKLYNRFINDFVRFGYKK